MTFTKQRIAMLAAAGAVALVVMAVPHAADAAEEKVCPQYDTGHLSAGDDTSFTYVAPANKIIVALCVKAGSAKQGNGPEAFGVGTNATSVTIRHSSGKDISHFSVKLTDKAVVTLPTVPPPPPTTTPPAPVVTLATTPPVVTTTTWVPFRYDRNCADGFAFNQGYIGGWGERCEPTTPTKTPPPATPDASPPVATPPTPPAEVVVAEADVEEPPAAAPAADTDLPPAPLTATPPTAPTLPATGSEAVLLQLAAALSALGAGAFLLRTARR